MELEESRPKRVRRKKTQAVVPPIKRDVNAGIRVKKALELRSLGHTYEEIATRVGYASKGACWTAVQRELGRSLHEPTEDVRTLELLRLDMMLVRQLATAVDGNDVSASYATANVLAIMQRRAALLGLDAQKDQVMAAQVLIREYKVPTEAV